MSKKIPLGLVCLFIFYSGSGLHSFIFNFDMNFGIYYQHQLSKFINELVSTGGGRTKEELQPIIDAYFSSSNENYPDDVMMEFYGRKIVQIVFSLLPLGVWFFIFRYKSKNKPLV